MVFLLVCLLIASFFFFFGNSTTRYREMNLRRLNGNANDNRHLNRRRWRLIRIIHSSSIHSNKGSLSSKDNRKDIRPNSSNNLSSSQGKVRLVNSLPHSSSSR